MLSKGIKIADQSPWLDYATYDEDGFVNGVHDNAPTEIKEAYEKNQSEMQALAAAGKMIAK